MTSSRRLLPWMAGGASVLFLALWAVRTTTQAPHAAEAAVPQSAQAPSLSSPARETDGVLHDVARSAVDGGGSGIEMPETEVVDGECTLTLEFCDPGGEPVTVPEGSLRASWTGGARELELRDAASCVVAGLPPGPVAIEVEAPGLRHTPQTFALDGEEPHAEDQVVLWPADWVDVLVVDGRGRPFTALATDRGLDPLSFFLATFLVRARRAAPLADDDPPDVPPPMEFWPSLGHGGHDTPAERAGALLRSEPGPMWVALEVDGRRLPWQPLPAEAEEVVFVLPSEEFEARLATLALHVVDPAGEPLAGARATLAADLFAHRRPDQTDVPCGDDGRVEFVHVVPGEFDLLVESGSAFDQRRVKLAAGERRDLGDVVLADGGPVALRIVDESGAPVSAALIEVAPFRPGVDANELFPPNLRRHSDADGRYDLKLPSAPAIVRAVLYLPGELNSILYEQSPLAWIDPARPPAGEVLLVVSRQRKLVLLPGAVTDRVRIVDAHGVCVWTVQVESGAPAVQLPPGDYEVHALDGEGAEVERRTVALREEPQVLQLP